MPLVDVRARSIPLRPTRDVFWDFVSASLYDWEHDNFWNSSLLAISFPPVPVSSLSTMSSPKTQPYNHLLDTGDKILAEASPYGLMWGIGCRADAIPARQPPLWRGLHLSVKTL